jgi:uncharacterized protein YndB with AHSA1/START domain
MIRYAALLIAIGLVPTTTYAEMQDDIAVAIRRDGETFAVTVQLTVDATPEQVFAVLTDYDHMAKFVSNVMASRVVRRDDERIVVEQKSRLALGPLHFDFTNIRVVAPVPFSEIRSRVTQGDMQGSSFTTRLTARGTRTFIDNRGSFYADRWIPTIIGNMVLESETRRQFEEFRAEILRRKDILAAPDK